MTISTAGRTGSLVFLKLGGLILLKYSVFYGVNSQCGTEIDVYRGLMMTRIRQGNGIFRTPQNIRLTRILEDRPVTDMRKKRNKGCGFEIKLQPHGQFNG